MSHFCRTCRTWQLALGTAAPSVLMSTWLISHERVQLPAAPQMCAPELERPCPRRRELTSLAAPCRSATVNVRRHNSDTQNRPSQLLSLRQPVYRRSHILPPDVVRSGGECVAPIHAVAWRLQRLVCSCIFICVDELCTTSHSQVAASQPGPRLLASGEPGRWAATQHWHDCPTLMVALDVRSNQ